MPDGSAGSRIRILMVENHQTVRESLRLMLETQPDFQVVAELDDGRDAARAVSTHTPDVVLLDLSMPNINGLEAAKQIFSVAPKARVCVLTRHNDHAHFTELIRAGVLGYVLKQSRSTKLLAAVRSVAAGREYVDDAMTSQITRDYRNAGSRAAVRPLSPREEDVLRQTAWGRTNKEIAIAIGLSVKTVEAHKTNGMCKLDLKSREDVVRYAVLRGWLQESGPI